MMAQEACTQVMPRAITLGSVVLVDQACNGTLIGYNRLWQLCHVCFLPVNNNLGLVMSQPHFLLLGPRRLGASGGSRRSSLRGSRCRQTTASQSAEASDFVARLTVATRYIVGAWLLDLNFDLQLPADKLIAIL
jgi:hypothetical protein